MIFNWFKKQALVRKGLSCGKSRRQSRETDWRDWFECSGLARWGLLFLACLAFARIGSWSSDAPLSEIAVLSAMLVAISLFILPLAVREVWKNNHLLLLMLLCLITNLILNILLRNYAKELKVDEESIAALLVPTALAPMLVTILISPSAGFVTAFMVALLSNLFMQSNPGTFLSSLLTGFAAAQLSQGIRRRSDLMMAGAKVGLVGLACTLLIWLARALSTDSLDDLPVLALVAESVWAIALGVATSFVVGAILPILEWLFDRITDISWVELADLKHPLLKRLAEEAPGTYHHSLNVANLAESAAEAIGANPTQCRVCSYFHDIGKLDKPQYFAENMSSGQEPHSQLAPSMSALIIISHVKQGVDLALKAGLRQPVIDVIKEHHGTSLVYYFYKRAMQQQEDARAGGKILKLREEDIPEVDPRSFSYPGPIPQTKESAIVSLADAVESGSRSLRTVTTQRIESLVKEIIKHRVQDGQLDESQLTFNEISVISERFTFTLKNMLHARIEYPKIKREPAARDKDLQPAKPLSDLNPQAAKSV
ncbi:MAG: HDIG domain-containing protein [Methylacidiphilales bacterium]|nr:HDIG domain-containing protein [Candidatus Methylacidiphilales bacterium]